MMLNFCTLKMVGGILNIPEVLCINFLGQMDIIILGFFIGQLNPIMNL